MRLKHLEQFAAVWMGILIAASAQSAMADSLMDAYINEGLRQNNEIRSLESRRDALKAEIDFAGSLDDPRIGFGLLNLPSNSYRFNREPMTQKQIFISQKLPWFGKLDLKSQQAALKAQRQTLLIQAKKLELARDISVAYYELSYLDAALDTNRKLAGLVEQAQQVAQTHYETGRGLQQDILQAQVEISKLRNESLILAKMRRRQEDRVNSLLNRERFMPVQTAPEPTFVRSRRNADELRQQMLQYNPWLKMKIMDIELADTGLDLAKKDYWPDMDVRLAYGQRDENAAGQDLADFVSASVTMNVPLWQKTRQDRKVDAGLSEKEASRRAYDALRLNLPHKLDAILNDLDKGTDSYRLFKEDLIPQTRDWGASALAAYEVGKVDFDAMIKARLRVLRSELQAARYHYDVLQKQAELEELIGGSGKTVTE